MKVRVVYVWCYVTCYKKVDKLGMREIKGQVVATRSVSLVVSVRKFTSTRPAGRPLTKHLENGRFRTTDFEQFVIFFRFSFLFHSEIVFNRSDSRFLAWGFTRCPP